MNLVKDFQAKNNLTREDFDKLLGAGSRLQAQIDQFWKLYELPMHSKIILQHWRSFPKQVHRSDAYRFLASQGYYRIIPSPATTKEYVFSSLCTEDDEDLALRVVQYEQQLKISKKGNNDTNGTN